MLRDLLAVWCLIALRSHSSVCSHWSLPSLINVVIDLCFIVLYFSGFVFSLIHVLMHPCSHGSVFSPCSVSSHFCRYALVELKPATTATSSSGEASAPPADGEAERVSFQSRFVHDSERPLSLRATWASPSACHLVLCSAHGRNDNSILTAINEHFAVVSALHLLRGFFGRRVGISF